MVIYFAEIAGVRAAVDPNHSVEVGVLVDGAAPASPGGPRPTHPHLEPCEGVDWIGRRTWREIATDFEGRELVTPSHGSASSALLVVPLRCEIDA